MSTEASIYLALAVLLAVLLAVATVVCHRLAGQNSQLRRHRTRQAVRIRHYRRQAGQLRAQLDERPAPVLPVTEARVRAALRPDDRDLDLLDMYWSTVADIADLPTTADGDKR